LPDNAAQKSNKASRHDTIVWVNMSGIVFQSFGDSRACEANSPEQLQKNWQPRETATFESLDPEPSSVNGMNNRYNKSSAVQHSSMNFGMLLARAAKERLIGMKIRHQQSTES
jgi:hypothetical protein